MTTATRYERFRDGFLAGFIGVLLLLISILGIWLTMLAVLMLAALGAAIATTRIWMPIAILIGMAWTMGIL